MSAVLRIGFILVRGSLANFLEKPDVMSHMGSITYAECCEGRKPLLSLYRIPQEYQSSMQLTTSNLHRKFVGDS